MPGNDSLDPLLAAALASRRAAHLLRSRQIVRPLGAVHVEIDGRRLINFSSNNYLGLTHHPKVITAIADAARDAGGGAASSGLISGYTDRHASAEAALAKWKGTEAAVLLPSGYQANHAAMQTLAAASEAAGRKVRFLLDKLAHASLIDGTRGSGLPFRTFGHDDTTKLARLLDDAAPDEVQIVVTESIFSMDGDAAALADIVALKQRRHFVLLVDEAHGSGVYGDGGAGYAAELNLTWAVDVFIVTLSKSLGLAGGAVCATKSFCDALINFGRAYIYSTSAPPMIAAACEAAIEVMREEPQRQQRVRGLARRTRDRFLAGGLKFPPGDSPIIPLILGQESRAIAVADALRTEGLLVLPVRPPTVPRGSSRLRITLSSEHSDEEVDRLIESVTRLTRG